MSNEILVSPTDTTYLYMARRSALRLTMRPRYPQRDPASGQMTGKTKGAFFGFQDGQLRVPKEDDFVAVDTLDGGESDPIPADEANAWLMGHRLYGNREEGFWRVDPTAPPVSQEEMQVLMDAAIRLDEDTLHEVIRQETAGWGRADIIDTAEKGLRSITEMREAAEAQAREEEQAAAKKPGPKPKAQPES